MKLERERERKLNNNLLKLLNKTLASAIRSPKIILAFNVNKVKVEISLTLKS